MNDISTSTAHAVEEDLAAARLLLEKRSPEQLAAALVQLHRSLLPAPEELEQPGRPSGLPSRRVFTGNWRPGRGMKNRKKRR